MEKIIERLNRRFEEKGLTAIEIPRLIKDIANILGGRKEYVPGKMKQRLSRLGWGEEVVDYRTLEMVVFLIESHGTEALAAGNWFPIKAAGRKAPLVPTPYS